MHFHDLMLFSKALITAPNPSKLSGYNWIGHSDHSYDQTQLNSTGSRDVNI